LIVIVVVFAKTFRRTWRLWRAAVARWAWRLWGWATMTRRTIGMFVVLTAVVFAFAGTFFAAIRVFLLSVLINYSYVSACLKINKSSTSR